MSRAVVFAYAIADGLQPVVGAAPFDVLSRQLPRMLVARLNEGEDRGVRFFPFLGLVEGGRSFLILREQLEPKALLKLHQQGDVEFLVDGLILQDRLQWRVLDGRSGEVRRSIELPLDPLDPLRALLRIEFEMTELLGISGKPVAMPAIGGEALGWLFVLKDELLRLEANLPESSPDPLRAARRCVELAADEPAVQVQVADFLALLVRRRQALDRVAGLASQLADSIQDAALLDRLAGIVYAAGDQPAATAMVVRAALLLPGDTALAERAAAMAFRARDDAAVRRIVDAARAVGRVSARLIAQLAASYDRSGDRAGRAQLVEELLGEDDLPVPVARLVVSFLLEEEQPALAKAVVERALGRAPDQSMLHYELGRACLMLDDTARAALAFQRALELGLKADVEEQARRLLRLSSVPGLWQGTNLVEKAIAADDLGAALAAVRALVRRVGPVVEAWLLFGIVHHKLGHLRRAVRLLRRALRCDETCPEVHNRLGIALLQLGSVQAGHEHLRRAHELAPADSSTLLHLAQAEALGGRPDLAAQYVDEAERLGASQDIVQAVRREISSARDSA